MFAGPYGGPYVTVGDEYKDANPLPERWKGKNMMTKGKPGLIDGKVLSLSEMSPYVEPSTLERRERIKKDKMKLDPRGMVPSNPPKKGFSGDLNGTFSTGAFRPEYQPNFRVDENSEPKKVLSMPPNIRVAPPKRGTYGVPGTAIGSGKEGAAQRFPWTGDRYISDPYDSAKRTDALVAKSTKPPSGLPFKAACRHQDFFDETTHGCPKVYTLDQPLPAKKMPSELSGSRERSRQQQGPAWKPGGVLVRDITKPPEYQEDPYELREKKVREERLKAEKQFKAGASWKPIGGTKSLPVRPIKFYPA